MLRLILKVLLAAAALAAVWAFVPMGGRTMSDRWHHARNPTEFFARTWAEVRDDEHPPQHPRAAPRSQARTGTPATRPTESHTDTDRKALDRIVSDHLER